MDKIIKSLNLKVGARDLRNNDPKVHLQAICNQWIPVSKATLGKYSYQIEWELTSLSTLWGQQFVHMCSDLAGSVGSRQHWLWDTARKKEYISFVFYCFENLSIAITLELLVRFRWGFQQNVPLLMRTSNQIENWKCHIADFDWFP